MSNDIYLIGEVGREITLANTIDKVNSSNSAEPLNVHIHSVGGSVYEGLAIYNYLKGLKQEVNTISNGLVASIASIIFLAGRKETRVVNNTDSFLIHLPMGKMEGNAKDFEKTAKELKSIEDKLSNIYVQETNLTKEEALELMNKDEMLDVNFIKEKGFVSTVNEFKAVAKFNINNKNEMSDTLTKEDAKGFFDKFEKTLKNFLGKKDEPTNKIVQDSTGAEIDFTAVAEDGTPQVGDAATINNEKAEGSYVMPSGETFVFVDGVLDSIVEVEAEAENEELEAAKKKIEELEASLVATNSIVAEKEIEVEKMTNSFTEVTNEFTELKNQFSSGNVSTEKKIAKEEKGTDSKRTFRNK